MRLLTLLLAGSGAFVTAGCAARPPVDAPAPDVAGQGPRWAGNLQPVQQRSGQLVVTGQNRVFGSVTARIVPSRPEWTRIRLSVALPAPGATSITWAVLPDRCGAHSIPLIGYEQFPLIEIGSNGRGEVSVELPMPLSVGSSYHVNVYSRGHQLENVITCANLRFQAGVPSGP